MTAQKSAPIANSQARIDSLGTTNPSVDDAASLMPASIEAWQSLNSTPEVQEKDEDNASYFVRALGYAGLTFSVVGMAAAMAFVSVREGIPEAIAMLSGTGSLNPFVLAALLGPACALMLVGRWMRRRADHKARPVEPSVPDRDPSCESLEQMHNTKMEQDGPTFHLSVPHDKTPRRSGGAL